VLPSTLATFLNSAGPAVALYHATDTGTALLAKLPVADITRIRGPVPMHLAHLLYQHPRAPVLRSVLTIYDDPRQPLALETFTNVADKDQREDFAALGWQADLRLHFFDEQLTHRLSKRVHGFPQPVVLDLIDDAVELLRRLPKGSFDFDAAKRAVLEATSL
jgi:hypothetical protein